MDPRKTEELLETIYSEREQGRDDAAEVLAATFAPHAPEACFADFHALRQAGLVIVDGVDGFRIRLTREGERQARLVVRRHRLAARLFVDLVHLDQDASERLACELEHALTNTTADAICTLLGHPSTCPLGHRIPEGACCQKGRTVTSDARAALPRPLARPTSPST